LQLTIPILSAVAAINRVMRKEEFKGSATKSIYSKGIRLYHHPLFHRLGAGSNWGAPSLNLNEAEPAGTKGQIRFPNSAKVRDIDTIVQSCP